MTESLSGSLSLNKRETTRRRQEANQLIINDAFQDLLAQVRASDGYTTYATSLNELQLQGDTGKGNFSLVYDGQPGPGNIRFDLCRVRIMKNIPNEGGEIDSIEMAGYEFHTYEDNGLLRISGNVITRDTISGNGLGFALLIQNPSILQAALSAQGYGRTDKRIVSTIRDGTGRRRWTSRIVKNYLGDYTKNPTLFKEYGIEKGRSDFIYVVQDPSKGISRLTS